jgi:hypothetical protein
MNNLKHPIYGAPQYLEVHVPQTTNGTLLAYDSNQQPIYKKKFLPLTAKKRLEQRNARLPAHLRLNIVVKTNQPSEPIPAPKPVETGTITTDTTIDKPKNKGGRPPKTQSNETK